LLHPKYGGENQASEITRDFERVLSHAMPKDVLERKFMGIWQDGGSRLQVGIASRFSRAHYLLMLRWFLRSKMEATGELVKTPPTHNRFRRGSAQDGSTPRNYRVAISCIGTTRTRANSPMCPLPVEADIGCLSYQVGWWSAMIHPYFAEITGKRS
jgi:hypothetical protein